MSLRTTLALILASILLIATSPPAAGPTAAPPAGAGPTSGGFEPAGTLAPPMPAAAVRAFRDRDCRAAIAQLEPVAAPRTGPTATFAALVQGLYAHACEDVEVAEVKLAAAAQPGGVLDDWRLLILADSAAARDHPAAARAALDTLLADYPDSPLTARALTRAADLAWRRRDAAAALALVERGRDGAIGGETAARLEALAWEIGTAHGDSRVRAEAARRLLVEAPLEARRLAVADVFRTTAGNVDWSSALSPPELLRRTETFLSLQMAPAALATLDEVAPAARDDDWRLLQARALTADRRGLEALRLLADAGGQAAVEWARAQAALDAATAYRGRTNLPSAERDKLRRAAQEHLAAAAGGGGGDDDLRRKALRRLFVELSEEQRFDDAVAVLRRLIDLDPDDTTGARYLWELGWAQYADRNFSGAVGYWTELAALYPGNRYARSGRYWTARAFEALGDRSRAQAIYAETATADTNDFYRKHALTRLGGGSPATAEGPVAGGGRDDPGEPWPEDPALGRARLLTDLGLDDLASSELEVVGGAADARAAAALAAVVAARRGDRVESIAQIRRAFPALGGPFQARVPREALRLYYPIAFEEVIRAEAARSDLPLDLIYGMIRQESAFNPRARSRSGARGLLQVMPATGREVAQRLGLPWSTTKLDEPSYNVRLGTTYFRRVLAMFDGDVDLALAGYNGGPYRIKRLWGAAGEGREIDAFLEGLTIEESKIYVKRIAVLSDSYRRLYPEGRG